MRERVENHEKSIRFKPHATMTSANLATYLVLNQRNKEISGSLDLQINAKNVQKTTYQLIVRLWTNS